MLLASPELDVRLVTTVSGDVRYRAGLCAGLLNVAGRRDIPIGLGLGGDLNLPSNLQGAPQAGFGGPKVLQTHPQVLADGVQAIISTIMDSDDVVTVIGIGPFTNIAEALRRCPQIAERARFVGMCGSVRVGYRGATTPAAEYNVFADIPAAKAVLSAPWEMMITPLDSCGSVVLGGEHYRRFHDHATSNPGGMAAAVLENYRLWLKALNAPAERLSQRSTTQYDAVAIYLAFADAALEMERLPIVVTEDGITRIDEGGRLMQVATGWRDREAFDRLFVDRLCVGAGEVGPSGAAGRPNIRAR